MGLVAKIWNEIRGNLLWQILVWIAGGGLLTALTQGVKLYQGHPMEWKVVGLMFVISTLALAVIVLLAVRRKVPAQQQSNQALATVALNTQLSIDEAYFAIEASHRRSIEEPLRAEIGMIPIDAGNRENYLVRSLIISILALDFMQIWIYIYGSQIQALEGLNKGGLTREAISGYYTFAATVYPQLYGLHI